ncbi:hypothetical protein [Thauera sp. 2A1]|uniref:hypothetical protein n=1 Tax=Thauera sp. 2A1 TaxID=2570191 RepID=UPI001292874C|nr:hypothetical protein [Thauera sp. 2A1]KAI5916679.1 hypothetical protein GH664_00685 [Thauera sp. 2A1]
MFATLLATVALCGAFNVVIDPLGIFGTPRISGLNATKPYLDHHRDLARWQAARRLCPTAGIFGNSRAEIGFDPEHPGFAAHDLVAYNHAIPGTPISIALRQLHWLDDAGCRPKLLIVGVDFFDFLGAPPARVPPPAIPPAPRIDGSVLAETVFSVTGLRDSLNTIAIQHASHPASLSPRGFNPLLNYIPEVAQSGHYALFRQRALENLKNWTRKAPRIHPDDGSQSVEYAGLNAFLHDAATMGTTVHVVIYPYHAQIRLMMERAGLGRLFAEWKASVLAAAEHTRTGNVAIKVWDFSGVSAETTEPIPAPGDRQTHLTYYWEAGHFKKALGDRILDRILLDRPGFGQLVTDASVDEWLIEDRRFVTDLASRPSGLIQEVDSLFPGASHQQSTSISQRRDRNQS